ncbi:unnamed protein product [Caenorhabditis bovis]|uniref:Uncharacterized protein n=1 Tax=Caenorhabditis bovis TaxID=2654633 RepID=A0A8S1EYV7_9PELO|nr:unnamed protein product [Caenorhabditis bovis]
MAKVSGAEEALATIETKPRSTKKSEAFLMSGDVLISLNRNVSSTYAKLLGDQLPPNTLIATPPTVLSRTSASAGVSFPSMNRGSKKASRLPVSTSQLETKKPHHQRSTESPTTIRMHRRSDDHNESDCELMFSENQDHVDENAVGDDSGAHIDVEKENDEETNEKLMNGGNNEEAMNSPNDELLNKSLRSSTFGAPQGNNSYSSSPHILHNESKIYEEDSSKKNESFGSNAENNNAKDTPSKRSVVTIDAAPSFSEEGSAYYTINESPIRFNSSGSPAKKPLFQDQVPSSSASASPSLHAPSDNRNGYTRSDSDDEIVHARNASINMMSPSGSSVESEAAQLARKLFELRSCTATDVADKLNEQNDFAVMVLVKYLELFQFSTMRIDAALREFLSRVELRGESSQRERLLRFFSERYLECNPSIFGSIDEVHTLTCALLLLNSDLHGPNMGRKMTARDFITNIGHTGCTYKRDLLKTLYTSIKDNAIVLEQGPSTKNSSRNGSVSSSQKRRIFEVDPNSVVEYHSGYLMRKYVRESDGAKTPFGRRSWKMVYARLRGLVLYFDSDETPKATSRYASLDNALSLHHAFAESATDYNKKAHVFRVRIAHGGEVLFQTGNDSEVSKWCDEINFVAAAFSSPTLPLPVTARPESAPMPRLPRMPCIAPISRQILTHESRVAELSEMIETVAASVYPERAQHLIVDRLVFLHFEKRRYSKYVSILRKHLKEKQMASRNSFKKSSIPICEDRLSYTDAVNSAN